MHFILLSLVSLETLVAERVGLERDSIVVTEGSLICGETQIHRYSVLELARDVMLLKNVIQFSRHVTRSARRNYQVSVRSLCKASKEDDNARFVKGNADKSPRILITGESRLHPHSTRIAHLSLRLINQI